MDFLLGVVPSEDDHFFKLWVTWFADILSNRSIVDILRTDMNFRGKIVPYFGRLCRLLGTKRQVSVKGSLILLMAITYSELIPNERLRKRVLVKKILRCLFLAEESIHLGVCKVLFNLLSSEILSVTDFDANHLSMLIIGSLMHGCCERKKTIRYMIHNLIANITKDEEKEFLNDIFQKNKRILQLYFTLFKEEEGEKTEWSFSFELLGRIITIATELGIDVTEMQEFFKEKSEKMRPQNWQCPSSQSFGLMCDYETMFSFGF
jgi:hypothetical protein